MCTKKNIPAKFLAQDYVDHRVINFANDHGLEVDLESHEICRIIPATDSFSFKANVVYKVWLYRCTDGSYISHRIDNGKKAIYQSHEFKKTNLPEVFEINSKKLRRRSSNGLLILGKA